MIWSSHNIKYESELVDDIIAWEHGLEGIEFCKYASYGPDIDFV